MSIASPFLCRAQRRQPGTAAAQRLPCLPPHHHRWADNDVYGHVNNVVYYSWFDTAVNAHLIEQGVLDIHAGGTIGLVIETQCNYFAPLAFRRRWRLAFGSRSWWLQRALRSGPVCARRGDDGSAAGHFVPCVR